MSTVTQRTGDMYVDQLLDRGRRGRVSRTSGTRTVLGLLLTNIYNVNRNLCVLSRAFSGPNT